MTLAGAELILSKIPEYPSFTAKVRGPFLHSKILEDESFVSQLGVNASGEKISKKFSFLFSSSVKYQEIHLET